MKALKNKNLLALSMATLILSGGIFYNENYRIPNLEKSIKLQTLQQYSMDEIPKIVVPKVTSNLSNGKRMTEEEIEKAIDFVQVPSYIYVSNIKFFPWKKLGKEDLVSKILNKNVETGDILQPQDIYTDNDAISQDDRLVEIPIARVVGNELSTGQLVDIELDYGDGTYDIVLSKKRIISFKFPVVGNEGQMEYLRENYTQPYIVVYMNRKERTRFYSAKQLGKFSPVIYNNENQEATQITFMAEDKDNYKEEKNDN